MLIRALALALCLTSCATAPRVVTLRVDPALTEEVAEPQLPANPTNGDLAEIFDAMRAALREANRRLRAIGSL